MIKALSTLTGAARGGAERPVADPGKKAGNALVLAGAVLCSWVLFFPLKLCGQQKPEIKAGVILSFSGGLEQWCSYIRQGIELALAEDAPVRISAVFEDDRSMDRKTALTAAQKLISIDKVDVIVSWTASAVPILSPLADSARIPFLAGAYDRNVANGGPYVFGAFVNYEIVPREIAGFLIKKRGARRLALMLAADDWSQSFAEPFREEAEKLGAQVLFRETVSPEEKDLRSLVLRLKKERIDAVLAPLYGGSLYSFLKYARELRFPGAIHVGDGMFEEDLKIAGPGAEGVYASQIWLESEELFSALKRRIGRSANPLQLGMVASGFDWVKHLQGAGLKIVREGRSISRETLKEELRTFRSSGYLGDLMYGAAPSHSGEIIMMVQSGRYVRVE